MKKHFFLIVSSCLFQFSIAQKNNPGDPVSYLALGDSYTIGESVDTNERWPVQLKKALGERGITVRDPKIIAQTGWRTDDMMSAAKNQLDHTSFDLVSLLIGVNNEYQGKSPSSFESEFEECLSYAISKSKNGSKGVFVMSIPDYGYTPFGKENQETISDRIDKYNEICKRISKEHSVLFISITDISRKADEDITLVADDQLHPSAKQYYQWVLAAIRDIEDLILSKYSNE